MTKRILITHLTFVGQGLPDATVRFAEGLTVIHGPSDTGKSFVLEAISYMLGGEKLKGITQLDNYQYVLLGLKLASGQEVTLRRGTKGGPAGLFYGTDFDLLSPVSDLPLAWKHGKGDGNISKFLLRETGLSEKRIRKNVNNLTIDMSFRYVVHLCVIGEEKIQSDRTPVVTNQMLKTADASAFKVVLQGTDDSHLVEVAASEVVNSKRKLQQAVIDELVLDIELQLKDSPVQSYSRLYLANLNASLFDQSAVIERLVQARDVLASRNLATNRQLSAVQLNLAETAALVARFELLIAQYDSDLERLELVQEADSILSYFGASECPRCGASPAHQIQIQPDQDLAEFGRSVDLETVKTQRLRMDLSETILGVSEKHLELETLELNLTSELSTMAIALREAEIELRPERARINQGLELRSEVERALVLQGQIAALGLRRAKYEDDAVVEVAEAPIGLTPDAVEKLTKHIVRCLDAWGLSNPTTASFDASIGDVLIEGQERNLHGKGVRSLLHSAFTIGLAQYCFEEGLPHPGFVILDSPLVAYRAPDEKNPNGPTADAEGLSHTVVEAFYRDIESNFDGQAIIIENTSPQHFLSPQSGNVQFSKVDDGTRYGLFPIGA
jgi:hypothetical protein